MSELVVGSLKGLAANSYVIDVASGSKIVQPGSILQVVSTLKTDAQAFTSIAAGGSAAITGLSVTITPTSTSSKIMVFVTAHTSGTTVGGVGTNYGAPIVLKRGATSLGIGDAAGSRLRVSAGGWKQATEIGNLNYTFLDSPATTSATTYSVDVLNMVGATTTLYVNRSVADTDNSNEQSHRPASTITVMEVAG